MTSRAVINGKVMRTPTLEVYDAARTVAAETAQVSPSPRGTGMFLQADGPRSWADDKALLVSLGVDGSVPFEQARVNAGLVVIDFHASRGRVTMRHATRIVAANDNHKIAAKAA